MIIQQYHLSALVFHWNQPGLISRLPFFNNIEMLVTHLGLWAGESRCWHTCHFRSPKLSLSGALSLCIFSHIYLINAPVVLHCNTAAASPCSYFLTSTLSAFQNVWPFGIPADRVVSWLCLPAKLASDAEPPEAAFGAWHLGSEGSHSDGLLQSGWLLRKRIRSTVCLITDVLRATLPDDCRRAAESVCLTKL